MKTTAVSEFQLVSKEEMRQNTVGINPSGPERVSGVC